MQKINKDLQKTREMLKFALGETEGDKIIFTDKTKDNAFIKGFKAGALTNKVVEDINKIKGDG